MEWLYYITGIVLYVGVEYYRKKKLVEGLSNYGDYKEYIEYLESEGILVRKSTRVSSQKEAQIRLAMYRYCESKSELYCPKNVEKLLKYLKEFYRKLPVEF